MVFALLSLARGTHAAEPIPNPKIDADAFVRLTQDAMQLRAKPVDVSLYTYGYRNVYELGPVLDVRTTKIPLVSGR